MYKKYEKFCGIFLLVLMCVSLLPVMYLGKYNHPTGDDYFYGVETGQAWRETGSVAAVIMEAAKGVAIQYERWQGTYSAMFLMYLAPNIWGGNAYRFVTAGILLLYTVAVFYILHPVLRKSLRGSVHLWLGVSSAFVLLTVQTTAFQGESFFWYNGSMYYTGFFAVTLFFFGLLARYLYTPRVYHVPILAVLAIFLAGGNYVSLLPTILILVTITALFAWRRSRRGFCTGALAVIMLAGLLVSALAPGNQIRESRLWEMSAWKAIIQSIIQGGRYLDAWAGKWWLLVAILLAPFFWHTYEKVSFSFRLPFLVVGYLFGIFCSMSCPLYYAMGNSGPARALAIVYYAFMFFSFAGYYYLLGAFYRFLERRKGNSLSDEAGKRLLGRGLAVAFVLLALMQLVSGRIMECTSVRALRVLHKGEAAAYEEEYQRRLQILEDDAVSEAVLAPYEHQPDMLYVGDFPGDPLDLTSVRIAQYFGKESVRVDYGTE